MPTYTVGPDGKTYTHYSAEEMGAGIVGLIIIALFVPVLATGYYTFTYFHGSLAWHPLFCIILAVIPIAVIGWLLYVSRLVRIAYFGLETIAATAGAFYFIHIKADAIWATAAAIVVFGIGAALTYAVTKY